MTIVGRPREDGEPGRHGPTAVRLPLTFDAALLAQDVATIERRARWARQKTYFLGNVSLMPGWHVIPLRSMGGQLSDTSAGGPGLEPFRDTEFLALTSYTQTALAQIRCEKRAVRLSALPPGAVIYEHNDFGFCIGWGIARLHIPITYSPDVVFTLDGESQTWLPGETWYGDFAYKHSVENRSSHTRIHLIVDVEVNDWLLAQFPDGALSTFDTMRIPRRMPNTELSDLDLSRFECSFVTSPLCPQSMPWASLVERDGIPVVDMPARSGSITVTDATLTMHVEGRNIILMPIATNRFAMIGGLPGECLELIPEGNRVARCTLIWQSCFGTQSVDFRLT